jgi:hypothetical protein
MRISTFATSPRRSRRSAQVQFSSPNACVTPCLQSKIKQPSTLFPAPEPFTADDAVLAAELSNGTDRRRGSLG